jgi:ATP-dependent Clp protease protease subunit
VNFIYTINPDADIPEMVIDSHIGPDEVDENGLITKGIDGAQWARELLALDSMGKKRVKVYINSSGGLVTDGYSICSAILHTQCRVDTYCRGLAASIAAVIFMCGRNRCMADYGILMFHNPFGGDNTEVLDKMKNSLATLIAERSGLTKETVLAIMARTTFLDIDEATDLRLATERETSSENNIGRLSAVRNDSKEFWKESRLIFNKALNIIEKKVIPQPIIQPTKMANDFAKINNRLGLMDEASEDSRMKALDKILDSAKDSDKKAMDASNALKDMEDKMTKMKSEMDSDAKKNKEAYDDLETKFVKMKAEKDEFEKTEKEKTAVKVKNDARDLITAAVKDGKIKNEADIIAKWTAKAEADITDVKDLLDTMGVNKAAANFAGIKDDAGHERVAGRIGAPQTPEANTDYFNKLVAEKNKKSAEEAEAKRRK